MSHTGTDSSGTEQISPEEVRIDPDDDVPGRLSTLLTPGSRVKVLEALLQTGEDPVTIRDLEQASGVHYDTVREQLEALEGFNIVEQVGKKGNARAYQLQTDHAVPQASRELIDVLSGGQTSGHLDKRYKKPTLTEVAVEVLEAASEPLGTEAVVAGIRDRGKHWATPESIAPVMEDSDRFGRDPETGHWRLLD